MGRNFLEDISTILQRAGANSESGTPASGSIAEAGQSYIITVRLVEVETGEIVVSSSIKVGLNEIEHESQLYIASTFQSPYGIALSPSSTGERIGFSAAGVSIQLGLAVNF